jgi:hypothetical protein
MVFGLSSSEPQAVHQRSSAIDGHFSIKRKIWKPGNQDFELGKQEPSIPEIFRAFAGIECAKPNHFLISCFPDSEW